MSVHAIRDSRALPLLLAALSASLATYLYLTGRIGFLPPPAFPDQPPPGVGSAESPLGTPPDVPSSDGYRFYDLRGDGSPVTWDACRPITYVINPDGMPAGVEKHVKAAAAEIAAATGYRIEFGGYTDEPFTTERNPYQPERYGQTWAPVLIAVVDPEQYPAVTGDVVGRAGPAGVVNPGREQFYVSGRLLLDRDGLGTLMDFDEAYGTNRVRGVLLHEWAHVVGLDHTPDPDQLMFWIENPLREGLQPGDRAGLAAANTGACAPWL